MQKMIDIDTSTSSNSTAAEDREDIGIESKSDDSRGSVAKTSSARVSSIGSTISENKCHYSSSNFQDDDDTHLRC